MALAACQSSSAAVPGAYPNAGTVAVTCPTPSPHELALFESRSVTAQDNGKTLVVHQTDRFSVFLDDSAYPLNTLQSSPAGVLGVISNGSVRGPNCYPVMFEALTQGQGTLTDGGFVLHVQVDNNAPVSTFPLH